MFAIPEKSEPVDISAADHTFGMQIDAIYVGGQFGTIVAQLRGDSEARPWNLFGAPYLFGDFVKVVKAGTDDTLTGLIGVRMFDTSRDMTRPGC